MLKAGKKLFKDSYNNHLRDLKRQIGANKISSDATKSVQEQIGHAWTEDQSSRLAYIEFINPDVTGSAEYWAFELAKANAVFLDWQHRNLMKKLLSTHGWIDSSRFGDDAANRALTLIQHADADPTFQSLALQRMEGFLVDGGVDSVSFANLWDRVAINMGKPQRFGTQPTTKCDSNGKIILAPIEDPEQLGDRRREVGLGSVQKQIERLSAERCR